MGVTDLKDSTLPVKLNSLFLHRLFKIMDRHDSKFVFHDGLFKILTNLINRLRAFNLVEHNYPSSLDFEKPVCATSNLFSCEETSVLSRLREVKTYLGKIKSFLPEGDNIFLRTDSSYVELSDLADEIEKLASRIDADPQRLSKVNDRLDYLYSLFQKHRVKDLDELFIKKEEINNIIKSIITNDERIKDLETLLEKEVILLNSLSVEMSDRRHAIIHDVELKITGLLNQLGMPNARFRMSLTKSQDYTPSGIDNADFLFSANKQIEPENLARIASGGELSRVMLSLKSLITKNINLPTIIFDEIDAGVSGETADKVGQILSAMGKYMQVVNITHLPQVASRGTKHYHVYKDETGDSTITRVKLLSGDERILEVARLLSGSEVTETAIKNARELIKAGKDKSR